MSPLAHHLFATGNAMACAMQPATDQALDSLARVDAALHGVTTGCSSLVPAIAHRVDSAKVFAIARLHLSSDSTDNARVCFADAMRLQTDDLPRAMHRAMRSLAYSVGILHPDYARAFHASGIGGSVRLVS